MYPRAELKPKYHHIDQGFPPLVNGARPPGQWQSLELSFQAPRFDGAGKKVANARFVKVTLNGRVVQADLEVPTPTGHAWTTTERPTGPLFFQGDHGAVALRKIRIRKPATP